MIVSFELTQGYFQCVPYVPTNEKLQRICHVYIIYYFLAYLLG